MTFVQCATLISSRPQILRCVHLTVNAVRPVVHSVHVLLIDVFCRFLTVSIRHTTVAHRKDTLFPRVLPPLRLPLIDYSALSKPRYRSGNGRTRSMCSQDRHLDSSYTKLCHHIVRLTACYTQGMTFPHLPLVSTLISVNSGMCTNTTIYSYIDVAPGFDVFYTFECLCWNLRSRALFSELSVCDAGC